MNSESTNRMLDIAKLLLDSLVFIAIVISTVVSFKNLKEFQKENRIKNKLETISQICLGILNPMGFDLPVNQNHFYSVSYYRIKNIGSYDGVRAFLGEMMKFPSAPSDETNPFYVQREACYWNGPQRYGKSWKYLFADFRNTCELMGVASGLEEFEKIYEKESHSENTLRNDADEYVHRCNLMQENISATSGSVTSCQPYAGSILEVIEETRRNDSDHPQKKKKRQRKNKDDNKQKY